LGLVVLLGLLDPLVDLELLEALVWPGQMVRMAPLERLVLWATQV